MEATTYKVVSLADGLSEYKELAKAYWNWIQGPDPDANPIHPSDPNLTFLRDDVIGSQLQHEVGILAGRGKSEVAPFSTTPITATTAMKFFFPVYHVCSASEHPYVKGGKCDTPEKRKNAAMFDLNNNYQKWAKISINGQGERNIVDDDLDNYRIETGEFELRVPEANNLNREAGFNLPPTEGSYPAYAAGVYLYLKELQPGSYRLDFGGRATDFHTQSVYVISVK